MRVHVLENKIGHSLTAHCWRVRTLVKVNPYKEERRGAPNSRCFGFEFLHCRMRHCNRTGDRECLSRTGQWRDYFRECER